MLCGSVVSGTLKCHMRKNTGANVGVGKLFSRRAAFRGWSRARACLVQLHAIEEIALAHNFAKCSGNVVSQRAKTVVSLKKKKKRSSPFLRRR